MKNNEVFQLISLLLQYPTEELINEDITEDIQGIANFEVRAKITSFLAYLQKHSLNELSEKYVYTFDFNEKTNLYLSYAKLKEERERGKLLVKLKTFYQEAGLEVTNAELPDYLPLFLEFVAIADERVSIPLLTQLRESIEYLKEELLELKSPYANLLEACLLTVDEKLN